MKQAFTLAEVLITLAIIGVVAAVSIPSVISNSQQQEFRTGLRKAVSVLNSAITMNMALDGETPYDNANLYGYLMRHMSVLETTTRREDKFYMLGAGSSGSLVGNAAFYTTDGMRFEVRRGISPGSGMTLYESGVLPCKLGVAGDFNDIKTINCGGCGSYGLNNNPDNTTKPPCMIMVDVNGDRKPNPNNANCKERSCAVTVKYAKPDGTILTDMFTLLVTEKEVIPFGIAAQRAMYNSGK
ncbi:MAG: type II secretion system protein [bacterium]|nr:type II secretion system protein [bacterium]